MVAGRVSVPRPAGCLVVPCGADVEQRAPRRRRADNNDLVVGNEHGHVGVERLGDEPGGGVHHELCFEQARKSRANS
jgi:hypothetical protein